MNYQIAPSLLSANFYNLKDDLLILEESKIKYLHLDVMDGNFVPNISFGIPVIKKIKENIKDSFIMDAHLMIDKPEKMITDFKSAGCDILTVHKEATIHLDRTIDAIKKTGMLAGVAINPSTPVSDIELIIKNVDLVLVMSVNPGFGGQKFIEYTLDKIKKLKQLKDANNYNYIIEIDGGVNKDNIKMIVEAGAELIVAGSAVFAGNIKNNIGELRNE